MSRHRAGQRLPEALGRGRWTVVLAVAMALGQGCLPAPRTLAEGCVVNTDCTEPLVCAFSRCHNACRTDRDCPRGLHCRAAERPFNVCLLDDELTCPGGRDRECPGDMVCGSDLVCRDGCRLDRDCLDNQTCLQGACANMQELQPDGGLAPGPTFTCLWNSDCQEPLVCRSGTCVRECRVARDCALAARCTAAGVCERESTSVAVMPADRDAGALADGYGASCVVNSDCVNVALRCLGGRCGVDCFTARDCPAGQCCTASNRCAVGLECLPPDSGIFLPPTPDGGCLNDWQCQDSARCNGFERCVDRRCAPAERVLCDDSNPCTQDICSEMGEPCSYRLMLVDADGDGRFPLACGGSADDCDDSNPLTFPNAPEKCDFQDNNCNGAVDEGRWQVTPGSAGTLTTGGQYPAGLGRPQAAFVGGQVVVVAASLNRGQVDAFNVNPNTWSLVSGPVPLGGSRTRWEVCSGWRGRIVSAPLLTSDGTNLMLTALETTFPGDVCCNTGELGSISAFFRTFTPGLTVLDGGTLTEPTSRASCRAFSDGTTLAYSGLNAIPGGAAWDSRGQQWVFPFADNRNGQFLDVFAALWRPGQSVGPAVHLVGPGGLWPPARTAGDDLQTARYPRVAALGDRLLFAWPNGATSSFSTRIRYLLMDRQLSTVLAGPFDLPTADYLINGLWSEGNDALLVSTAYLSGAGRDVLWRLSADGGLLSRRALPTSSHQAAGFFLSGFESAVLPVDGGLLHVNTEYVVNRDVIRFGWSRPEVDAGWQYLRYPLSRRWDEHTDYAVVATSPRRVALFWQDGEVQKLGLECVDAP